MTYFEKIKNMDEHELAEFLADVSDGRLADDYCLDICCARSITDCESDFCVYDKTEYVLDYLRSSVA